MKKILIVIVLFVSFALANATETFNAEKTATKSISTRVIVPFLIEKAQDANQTLPTVISGQTRNLDPNAVLYIFKVSKDIDHAASFTFAGVNPKEGVTLNFEWLWTATNPLAAPTTWGSGSTNISQGWVWDAGETEASVKSAGNKHTYYCVARVNSIVAAAGILPGLRTFVVSATGQYTDL